jgi:hypothetical protein
LGDASIRVPFLRLDLRGQPSARAAEGVAGGNPMAGTGTWGIRYGIADKIFLPRLAELAILTLYDPADTGGEVPDAVEVRTELRGRIADECAAAEVVAPRIPVEGSG